MLPLPGETPVNIQIAFNIYIFTPRLDEAL